MISQITEENIRIIAKDFVETFRGWTYDNAYEYLHSPFLLNPEFCLQILQDGILAAGIFCKLAPYQDGKMLVIEALHVRKEFRNKKIGRILMKEIIKKTLELQVNKIGLLAPNSEEFPISWYKQIGFKETGWVEMELDIRNINNF